LCLSILSLLGILLVWWTRKRWSKGQGRLQGGFIWASEQTGYHHLEGDSWGAQLGAITQGSWIVEQVAGSNETTGILYFTATYDSPLETHLYSTNLFVEFDWSPLKPKHLTEGCHNVVLDHNIQRFVDIHDSLISPPRVLLCSPEDGSILVSIYEQPGPTPRTGRFQLVRLWKSLQVMVLNFMELYISLMQASLGSPLPRL